jgi:hypothetical protein
MRGNCVRTVTVNEEKRKMPDMQVEKIYFIVTPKFKNQTRYT